MAMLGARTRVTGRRLSADRKKADLRPRHQIYRSVRLCVYS